MNTKDALAWFEKIEKTNVPKNDHYEIKAAAAWLAEAQSALEAVLPKSHALLARWNTLVTQTSASTTLAPLHYNFNQFRAIFTVAYTMLREGRLSSLVAGIQAETVEELLDQADELLTSEHVVAATVIAGGALETHLRHLCDRHGLTIDGSGSIENYNMALARARKAGNEVCTLGDTKQVTSWGESRNKAAHDPGNFKQDAAAIQLMTAGIRQFIARVA
jgi:hypothetical protein